MLEYCINCLEPLVHTVHGISELYISSCQHLVMEQFEIVKHDESFPVAASAAIAYFSYLMLTVT
jgi:hypothetical protein